ncbi:MAG: efflux RND transporter periplasmic adaptor subunit [Nitrospinae bacterium]|nr:efflux RND transporter periplasmic adaptor subunit [Nitrospinota bacterium]
MRKNKTSLVLFTVAAMAVSCSGSAAPPQQNAAEKKTVKVKVSKIEPGEFRQDLTLNGVAKAWKEVVLAFEAGGRVARLGFEKGARVKAGQPLLWLDGSTAAADVAAAQAARDLAALEHRKLKALEERKAGVSEFQMEQARLNQDAAEARLAGASAYLAKHVIKAPLSGAMVNREVEVGAIVAPGQPLARLVAVNPIKISVGLPEKSMVDFSEGKKAKVTFDAFPDKEFEGKISFIAPAVNPVTRVFDCEVTVDNGDMKILPDMSAKVTFGRSLGPDSIIIPQNAVVELADGHAVYVVEKGVTARQRRVVIEDVSGELALVRSGLAAGDELVISGQRSLVDGDRVEISGK